ACVGVPDGATIDCHGNSLVVCENQVATFTDCGVPYQCAYSVDMGRYECLQQSCDVGGQCEARTASGPPPYTIYRAYNCSTDDRGTIYWVFTACPFPQNCKVDQNGVASCVAAPCDPLQQPPMSSCVPTNSTNNASSSYTYCDPNSSTVQIGTCNEGSVCGSNG